MFSALAAPQTIIKIIRNIQRNFLWNGHKQGKTWALVSWDKLCKPTSLGGLGLRDLGKLNNVMGEKICGDGSNILMNFGRDSSDKNILQTCNKKNS
jgi:hypothetical protein